MPGERLRGAGSRSLAGLVVAAVLLLAMPARAAESDPKPPSSSTPPSAEAARLPPAVETKHTISLGSRSLDYRAIAEPIALTDAKGARTASIFTVTYLVEPKQGQPRPVAFLFNGGPGAASAYLHLGAVGPRVMEPQANGTVPGPPVRLVDNPSTWLDFTDLVFVDPVGTGFSRGEGKDDNPSKPFFNVHADLESLDTVVRLWLTRHQRWASPVYLVGESYGGFRVAAMAKSLAHDEGIVASGLVMVSPALNTALLNPDVLALAGASVELPSYAAAAAALAGKTDFDLKAVEQFALGDYLVGLANMKGVPAARRSVHRQGRRHDRAVGRHRPPRARLGRHERLQPRAAPVPERGAEPLRRHGFAALAGQSLGQHRRRSGPGQRDRGLYRGIQRLCAVGAWLPHRAAVSGAVARCVAAVELGWRAPRATMGSGSPCRGCRPRCLNIPPRKY